MAGRLFPLILLPRYSTYVGGSTFTTLGMDVTAFEKAIVNVWRGVLNGTGPGVQVSFEESSDQEGWEVCTGGAPFDPGQETEEQKTVTLNNKWFRLKLVLSGTGTDVGVSCYAVGYLVRRPN